MADKKITDLTLRSNVNDDVNFPVDDGVQTYRCTAPQMKTYALAQMIDPKMALNYSLAASVGSSALTISLKDAGGNNASSSSPVSIYFRSSTLTSGLPVLTTLATSLSTVISSGSTAGHVSAENEFIYIYAINNSGAIELAWSSAGGRDEGKVYSTTAEGGAGAADSRTVLYSTSARSSVAIRFLGRFLVNESTAGTWASAPIEISLNISNYGIQENEICLTAGNGFGSSSTRVRRFANVIKNVGSDITYVDSATLGAVFTINRPGVYTIDYADGINAVAYTASFALGKNVIGTALSGSIETDLVFPFKLGFGFNTISDLNSAPIVYLGATLNCSAGDTIMAMAASTPTDGVENTTYIRITKVSG